MLGGPMLGDYLLGVMLLIAGVVWAIRLEGKVALADQQNTQILDRLERIERLIDQLVKFNAQ